MQTGLPAIMSLTGIKFRKLFFYTLSTIFVMVTLAVVSYAKGYRFDANSNIFVHSGSLAVKSVPRNVEIYVDGRLQEGKHLNFINDSYQVNGFRPGDYQIEVKKSDYQSWVKKISIHSNLSTEFWNVVLPDSVFQTDSYLPPQSEKFFVSPDSRKIASVSNADDGFKVTIIDIGKNSEIISYDFPKWKFIGENLKENIEWSPNGKKLIVPAIQEDKLGYFLADTEKTDSPLQFSNMKKVRWDFRDNNLIFFMAGNNLYKTSIETLNKPEIIAENIASYDISQSDIYYLGLDSGIVYRIDPQNPSQKQQVTLNPLPDAGSDLNYQLIVYDQRRIAFVNYDKQLAYIFNEGESDTYFQKLGAEVKGVEFSDDGKKLLFWNDNEINVYFARKWDVQPTREENETRSMVRYSTPIKNVQWFYFDYEHVIFSAGKSIKFVELDYRDRINSYDLVSLANYENEVIYSKSLQKLFFLNDADDSKKLFSINFPEETGFLPF